MLNPKPPNDPDYRVPVQCFILKFNGSWPLQTNPESTWSKLVVILYQIWSWLAIICVAIVVCSGMTALVITDFDLMIVADNCSATFMGALNFIRMLHMNLYRKRFGQIMEEFVQKIWITKGSHPHIERECRRNMIVFSVMTIMLICLIQMYFFVPLAILLSGKYDPDHKPLPFKMAFFYNPNYGWKYVFSYLFSCAAGYFVVSNLAAEDSIFGFFVTYTCGQFRILQDRIDAIVPEAHQYVLDHVGPDQNARNWHFQRKCTEQLNQIAYRHNTLIQFANVLEDFYSPILFANFIISSLIICMVGFQVMVGSGMFIGDYIKFTLYIISSLIQLFVLCWNGDTLIQKSTDTIDHLYACNWEGDFIGDDCNQFGGVTKTVEPPACSTLQKHRRSVYPYPPDKNFRSNLQFMIMCSQRPVRITAMKFSTLSLQTFTSLLSTSMSYFALLQTVYKKLE